ncbi:MAG: helix-turn-helix transcriptional regulator [Clostridia bacterium]|nr:helix-turn-helix transcriptional regulator [Clostridia bacterium]MBR0407981.1 helix-turn-helix transcriptional regulator [Clostridia bacterium]
MAKITSVQFDQYSSMGNNQTEFEACYTHIEEENFRYISHCHDFYELYLHLRGGKMIDIDQYYYEMEPNQLYIIPPFSMHGVEVPPKTDYERAFLYITSDTLKVCGCGQIDLDAYFQSKVSNGHHQFPLTPEEAQKCKRMMLRLLDNQKKTEPLSRFQDYCLLLPILQIMCESMRRAGPTPRTEKGSSAIHDILMYVNENYMKPLSVDALAQQFGVSVSYLAHEFKKYTSRSVYDYVLYRRVMLAKKLIPDSVSLNTVSEQCGFENYSNFLRLFYKYVGVSPKAYKKALPQR